MGKWNVANAPSMTWAEGHLWRATLDLPAGAASFKFVQVSPAGQSVWESGDNRSITVAAGSGAGEPVLLQVVAGVWNMPAVSDAIVAAQKAAAGGGDNGQDGKKTAFALPQWPFSGKEAPSQAQSHGSKADAAEVAKVAAPKAATTAPAVAVPVTVVSAAKPQQTDVMVVEPVGSAANAVVENSSPVTAAAVAPPAAAVTDDDNSAKRSGPLDAVARNAGYLALGVAGAAGLGALAMDASMVVDLAMLGAVGAAAAAATDSRRKVVEVTQHQEGADSDAPRRYARAPFGHEASAC